MTSIKQAPITDAQIHELRAEYLAGRQLSMIDICDVALGRHGASRSPRRVERTRAHCAEILGRRTTEKKNSKQLGAEIAETLKRPRSAGAEAHVLGLLERNPGLAEANLRSFLHRSHGDSTALDHLLTAGQAVRRRHKLYRVEDAP